MILLYSQKCNTNFEKNLNYCDFVDINSYCECPFCGSNDFIKWGKYQRGAYFISNNKIVFRSIDIQRVKCKKCGKTHTSLPSIIVPYKQPVLDVILSASLYTVAVFIFPFILSKFLYPLILTSFNFGSVIRLFFKSIFIELYLCPTFSYV